MFVVSRVPECAPCAPDVPECAVRQRELMNSVVRRLRSCLPLARGHHPVSSRALKATVAEDEDSCSLALLIDLFRDVPVADRNATLCSRMVGLNLARVRVATSQLCDAGNGLFASRAIALGEIATLYPCDAPLSRPVAVMRGWSIAPGARHTSHKCPYQGPVTLYEVHTGNAHRAPHIRRDDPCFVLASSESR